MTISTRTAAIPRSTTGTRFDLNGRETFVEHVGEDGWPNLGRVVEELYASWQGRTD